MEVIAIANFVGKMTIYSSFFKKCQVFGKFLTFDGNFPTGQIHKLPFLIHVT